MIDQYSAEVARRLGDAQHRAGLSLRRFASSLGTSPSRFSAYRSGRTAPSAAFLLRAERIADGLCLARRDRIPSSLDAVDALRRAIDRGDEDWTYAIALEVRDRLRDILRDRPELAAAWEAEPVAVDECWWVLVTALVSHEFDAAGLAAPRWAVFTSLDRAWVLDTPRLSEAQIMEQTPPWLAERNIFVAAKDLVTA